MDQPEPFAPAVPDPVTPPPAYWMPPEPVRGPVPGVAYAGFPERLVAYVIDWVILGVLSYVIAAVTILIGAASVFDQLPSASDSQLLDLTPQQVAAETTLAGAVLLGVGLAWLFTALYFILMWRSGATIGMRAFGMRVAREEDGRPIGFGRATARYLGYLVDWIALGVGLLWVAVDDRHQGWHDKIAGTLVVKRV